MAYRILDKDGQPLEWFDGREVTGSDVPDSVIARKVVDEEKRIVKVVVSSDRPDRDGDRVNQQGIDHRHARVVLYAHDYGSKCLPIGKILSHNIRTRKGDDGKTYSVTIEKHHFNPAGSYELSDAAWKLIQFGSLNACSIGFIPTKLTRPESEARRQELGLGPSGIYFDAVEHLETSWCPLPANRDAIREAFGKGIISRTDAQILFPGNWHEINKSRHWLCGVDFIGDPVSMLAEVRKTQAEVLALVTQRVARLENQIKNVVEAILASEQGE